MSHWKKNGVSDASSYTKTRTKSPTTRAQTMQRQAGLTPPPRQDFPKADCHPLGGKNIEPRIATPPQAQGSPQSLPLTLQALEQKPTANTFRGDGQHDPMEVLSQGKGYWPNSCQPGLVSVPPSPPSIGQPSVHCFIQQVLAKWWVWVRLSAGRGTQEWTDHPVFMALTA